MLITILIPRSLLRGASLVLQPMLWPGPLCKATRLPEANLAFDDLLVFRRFFMLIF
jgi:hypothetical protein